MAAEIKLGRYTKSDACGKKESEFHRQNNELCFLGVVSWGFQFEAL